MRHHKESARQEEQYVVVLTSDGKQCLLDANDRRQFTVPAGSTQSDLDVLIGARHATAEGTGSYYPLQGELAQLLVFDRVLDADERHALHLHLARKWELLPSPVSTSQLAEFLQGESALSPGTLSTWLQQSPNICLPAIRAPYSQGTLNVATRLTLAEALLGISDANELNDALTSLAAALLDDPYLPVAALAEWSIAQRVGHENNGQELRWPQPRVPDWYQRWTAVPLARRVEMDWVRQAVASKSLRDPVALRRQIAEYAARSADMTQHYRSSDALTQSAARQALIIEQHERLLALAEQTPAAEAEAMMPLWLEARRALRNRTGQPAAGL